MKKLSPIKEEHSNWEKVKRVLVQAGAKPVIPVIKKYLPNCLDEKEMKEKKLYSNLKWAGITNSVINICGKYTPSKV